MYLPFLPAPFGVRRLNPTSPLMSYDHARIPAGDVAAWPFLDGVPALPVPGFDRYRVDAAGNVWTKTGAAPGTWRKMRPGSNGTRHQHVQLTDGTGRLHKRYVHRLVLEAFAGPCPVGKQVAHWDGNAGNNALSNLRYATPAENAADKRRHGRQPGKLTDPQLAEVRRRIAAGEGYVDIARDFGVTRQAVRYIAGRMPPAAQCVEVDAHLAQAA